MNDALISEITSFTLAARGRLEQEADEQLQGLYGWLSDGSFVDAGRRPAIQSLPEAAETRRRLEQFAADEAAAGLTAPNARKKLLRETAFTWLNRLVGFRLLEDRKLIKQTISKLGDSNAFKFWLVEDANTAAYAEYQRGDMPKNAMDEGPSEVAYRQFLLAQCASLATEVSILFDPANLPSRLCPRPAVLKELVESINAADLADAWKPGNEETLGWLYQAFNAQELQDAFAAARESKKKFEAADIPAVTQLFTIRWVVRFLVENTLGRLWVEMHPDSRLKDQLGYLVPVQRTDRLLKHAREITFLDPCCGSMHFGLLAFDLFVDMYREELERAGQPDWPAQPSVSSIEDIAGSIVANNIHGIDLDTRAVQLSALALFLRARTLNSECAFTDQNLASANVEEITGGRLEEFIQRAQFSHPIYERILRSLATQLKDSANLGSLLRVEKDLERLISAERQKAETDKQFALAFPGLDVSQFKTQAGLEEFFGILTEQVMRHLDAFVQETRAKGQDRTHFTREAAKGLRFMRLIEQRYDVVTTNPPYLSGRKMNKRLAALMADQYNAGKQDLYAAFILRCQELLAPQGLLGMLTMHSYMFISTYEEMRKQLREQVAVETLAHFGGGLFAVGNPGTLQTAAFVLRKEQDKKIREAHRGVYFRLVRERDSEAKRLAFETTLAALLQGDDHHQLFHYVQADFDSIPGKPWVYWIPKVARSLFLKFPSLSLVGHPKQGLSTADKPRFVRLWWEVGCPKIGIAKIDRQEASRSRKRWFPYMKGGSGPWYCRQNSVVNWFNDGAEIVACIPKSVVRNPDFYFKPGITWSKISSRGFSARLQPQGFIFSDAGMTCYPKPELLLGLLAVVNSRTCRLLLAAINPTINYQVGDIERLPVPNDRSPKIDALVNQCVELAQQDTRENEITYNFIQPLLAGVERSARQSQLAILEAEVDAEVSRLYGLSEEDLASIDHELCGVAAVEDNEDTKDKTEEAGDDEEDGEAAVDLRAADCARSWLSYAFGTVLGRYGIGEADGLGRGDFDAPKVMAIRALIDPDGVMMAEKGHPQDIVRRTVECLEAMRGRETAHGLIRTTDDDASGDPEDLLRGWLDRFTGQPAASFWKYHHQLYRKCPIYWPFQSPKKHFTAWVFHERFGPTTLFTIKQLVDDQCRLIEREITSLRPLAATNRAAAKKLDQLLEATEDIREFSNRLQTIANGGYTFCIDDGVLLNAAPLHPLLPSWPETKKAWQDLEAGKYDWAQQAMKHWPDRVKEACKTNKSFAIAHGLA